MVQDQVQEQGTSAQLLLSCLQARIRPPWQSRKRKPAAAGTADPAYTAPSSVQDEAQGQSSQDLSGLSRRRLKPGRKRARKVPERQPDSEEPAGAASLPDLAAGGWDAAAQLVDWLTLLLPHMTCDAFRSARL